MPIISYDYVPRPFMENGKLGAIYIPIIPIKLSANHKMYPRSIKCLLDSGADFNLMPADVGEKMGLNIKRGRKRQHLGIGNVGIVAYAHPVKIFAGGHSFTTEMDFSYDHKIPLLGRSGFFAYFKKIVFNEKSLQVDLHY